MALTRELWDHNAIAISAMRESFKTGIRRMVISGPTGSGKTHLAAGVVDSALSKGRKVAFVVPYLSLIDQTVEGFYHEGITEVGVIQADHHLTDWSKPVQVCSIQTIGKRQAFPDADVIVFDECHLLFKAHRHWMTLHGPKHNDAGEMISGGRVFVGLSATPYAKGLGDLFETLIPTGTTQGMIDAGILSPFRVFATGHPDMRGVKTLAGDFHEGETAERMQRGTLTADIIATYRKQWGRGKTLVFAVDCAHAKTLAARFNEAGIKAAYQDADTAGCDRREIKRAFHAGEIEVVCNVGTLVAGVDWDVRCLVLARPTKSEILLKQIIGRSLRTAPPGTEPKPYALILDHSDTTSRLGFVTDIEHDHLDSTERRINYAERKKLLPKLCSKCEALLTKKADNCWNCGHAFAKLSAIQEADGDLIEVQRGTITMGKKGGKREYSMSEKAEWFSQIKRLRVDRNKSEGWAAHTYKAKFGVWPNDPRIRQVEIADFITTEVYSFVKFLNIQYAKRMEKQRAMGGGHV
jgi:superfamily II DNA or RNA helicase